MFGGKSIISEKSRRGQWVREGEGAWGATGAPIMCSGWTGGRAAAPAGEGVSGASGACRARACGGGGITFGSAPAGPAEEGRGRGRGAR